MATISKKYSFIWYGFCPGEGETSSDCEDISLDTLSQQLHNVWQIDGNANAKAWIGGGSGAQSFTQLRCGRMYYIRLKDGVNSIDIPHAFVSPYGQGITSDLRLTSSCEATTPTPYTATETETFTPNTPTLTDTVTDTESHTNTLTDTVTDTLTDTVTDTESHTNTLTDTVTDTESHTTTATESETSTLTDTVTDTESQTATLSDTLTDTLTDTVTDTESQTATLSDTLTDTLTDTVTDTESQTTTPTDTLTDTLTDTATDTESHTDTLTDTVTDTETDEGPEGSNPNALGYIVAQIPHNNTSTLAGSLFNDTELNLDSLDADANGFILTGRNAVYAGENATLLSNYISTITDFASGSTEIGSKDPLSCDEPAPGDFFGVTTIGGNRISPCVIAEIPLNRFNPDGSFTDIAFDQGPLTNQAECSVLNAECPAAINKTISNLNDDNVGVLYSIWLPVDKIGNNNYKFYFTNPGFPGGSFSRSGDSVISSHEVSFNGTIYRCFTSSVSLTPGSGQSTDGNGWSVHNGQLSGSDKVITFHSEIE